MRRRIRNPYLIFSIFLSFSINYPRALPTIPTPIEPWKFESRCHIRDIIIFSHDVFFFRRTETYIRQYELIV